jgi:hypothetical protein
MRAERFKRFYADGVLVGYQVGPGPQVILAVDPCNPGPAKELWQIWFGRVLNIEQVREALEALGDPRSSGWQKNIDGLELNPAAGRPSIKEVGMLVWHEGELRGVAIECQDVAER